MKCTHPKKVSEINKISLHNTASSIFISSLCPCHVLSSLLTTKTSSSGKKINRAEKWLLPTVSQSLILSIKIV